MKKKVIYYLNEDIDDFARTNITRKPLGKDFKYVHTNKVWNFFSWVLHILVTPIAILVQRLYSRQIFKNKIVLKKHKKDGFYIYANHTNLISDAFSIPLIDFPKKTYVICNPDATSIKGVRNIVQMLGAIPLGSTIKETKEMIKCMNKRIDDHQAILIYPEAHIWPYYNKIRNFSHVSFKYPCKKNVPVYALTHCYKKSLILKKPRIVSYFDGPFYPDPTLDINESSLKLRNEVYEAMVKRANKYSKVEYVKYEKKEEIPFETQNAESY